MLRSVWLMDIGAVDVGDTSIVDVSMYVFNAYYTFEWIGVLET